MNENKNSEKLEKWAKKRFDEYQKTHSTRILKTRPQKKRIIIPTIILGIVIVISIYIDLNVLTATKNKEYEDALIYIDKERYDYDRVTSYVRHIVSKVKLDGFEGIENRWAKEIPPEFKINAEKKIKKLCAEEFSIDSVGVDKVNIYNVKCVSAIEGGEIVFFEVLRKIIGGKWNFFLHAVY